MLWFLLSFSSAVFSALAALMQKKVLFDMDPLEFSLKVTGLSLIFSFMLLPWIDNMMPGREVIIIIAVKSVLGAFAFYNVMLAIQNLELSRALPLLAATPALVAITAFVIIGDRITLVEAGGLFLIFFGSYILELRKGDGILSPFRAVANSKAHIYIFTALFIFTATSVADKYILTSYKTEPKIFLLYQQFFAFLFFALFWVFNQKRKGISQDSKRKSGSGITTIIVILGLVTFMYRYTQIEAVKLAPVALVLSVKRLSVLFATVAGGKFYNENFKIRRTIAAALIVAGTIFLVKY